MITIEKKTARFNLQMTIVRMGRDLCISLAGGDTPHIGAVALAIPHSGLRAKNKIDASVSILTVTGHKEDELARKISKTVAAALNCTVSVSCGIHLEGATQKEISEILNTADEILNQALKELA